MRSLAVFAGFLIAGLSPSWLDYKHGDERERGLIVLHYALAGALIFYGTKR
jgi:hypothetical protein